MAYEESQDTSRVGEWRSIVTLVVFVLTSEFFALESETTHMCFRRVYSYELRPQTSMSCFRFTFPYSSPGSCPTSFSMPSPQSASSPNGNGMRRRHGHPSSTATPAPMSHKAQ